MNTRRLMPTAADLAQIAHTAGMQAFRDGHAEAFNPYPIFTRDRSAWFQGFEKARKWR